MSNFWAITWFSLNTVNHSSMKRFLACVLLSGIVKDTSVYERWKSSFSITKSIVIKSTKSALDGIYWGKKLRENFMRNHNSNLSHVSLNSFPN